MSTLIVTDAASGQQLDRVTLADDGLHFHTGTAEPMFAALTSSGSTPQEAFDLRTAWSNGYVRTTPVIDVEALPAIPGLRAQVTGALTAAFNPNQARDNRGRWTKNGAGAGGPELPTVPDGPAGPSMASRTAKLRAGIESGQAKRRPLSGGAMASVDLVTFNDGTQAVQKFTRKVPTGRSPKDQNDAEELSAKVAGLVGVRTPAIERVSDAQIVMEYVDEAEPGTSLPSWRADALTKTPDGLRMGLLDLLINNPDRHGGNYLVDDDEKGLTAIDHGFAWDDLEDYYPSPFVGAVGGRSNPFSPEDMAALRPRLEGLRGDFEAMGHGDWHDQMMEMFAHAEGRAVGTERLLP